MRSHKTDGISVKSLSKVSAIMLFFYLCSGFILLTAFVVLKRKTGHKPAMGGWLSYLWWGGDPDAAHPVSGLTRRDVHAVQASWAPVYTDPLGNGTDLLRRLFTAYPETREFFKMVRKLPESEWVDHPQFRAHVLNLMTSLNLAVRSLHQPEVVAAMMNKLGESHGRRKIKQEHFHGLKIVIVKMFIEVLHLDDATLASWGKTVDFWYKHIFQTLNDEATR